MKKIFQLTALLMLCLFGACSEDALDDLSGKYDMERNVYTEVVEQTTDKVGKGIKRINIEFADEAGSKWELHINSNDWVLQGGIYQVKSDDITQNVVAGTLYGAVGNNGFVAGNLEVTLLNGIYYLDGLFQGADGKQYSCDYKGAISCLLYTSDAADE